MPAYKLTYFNAMGLAEPIRLLLKYMDQDFEDVRFERADWPNVKPTMPFGKVPVLEIDGQKMCQSASICRYLGRLAGLGGQDDWESLQIDMLVDTFLDFRMEIVKFMHESDPDLKEKKKDSLLSETLPFYMSKFEETVQNNGGHLVNGSLSWADIYIMSLTDSMNGIFKCDTLEDYPNMRELKQKVFTNPKLREWVENRPKTDI